MTLRSLLLAALLHARCQALSFLLVGDWGGRNDLKPTTKGLLDDAEGMGKVARRLNASFVLGLGDNFYHNGISSYNLYRFNTTFEDVFKGSALDIDWHILPGNHDHIGDLSLQVAYSQNSTRWNFPAPYYNFTERLPSGELAEFLMLDAVELTGLSFHDEYLGVFVAATGPSDSSAAERQWAWLEYHLAVSQADYLFVAAHYPVWSGCSHGSTQQLVQRLRPLLAQYHATAYLSGHDHCLMHLRDSATTYVVSGAGAGDWYEATQTHQLKEAELLWHLSEDNRGAITSGFASITLTEAAATVAYYSNNGTLLHQSEPIAPRERPESHVRHYRFQPSGWPQLSD